MAGPSASLESRRAALGHRAHALAEVRRAEEPALLGGFTVGRRPDLAGQVAAHRGPDGRRGQRRRGRDLGRQRVRLGADAVGGHQQVAQPDAGRLLAANPAASEPRDVPMIATRAVPVRCLSQRAPAWKVSSGIPRSVVGRSL